MVNSIFCFRELITIVCYFYRDVSFEVLLQTSGCNNPNEFNEGVEFSYQFSSLPNEWIPIKFIYDTNDTSSSRILIGDFNNFSIRGYTVFDVIRGSSNAVKFTLCGFNTSDDSIRFRWLQTSLSNYGSVSSLQDVWILDNIAINLVQSQANSLSLLHESFSEPQLK